MPREDARRDGLRVYVLVQQERGGLRRSPARERSLCLRPEQLTALPLVQRPLFPGITVPLTLKAERIVERVQTIMRQDDGYCAVVLADQQEDADHVLRDVGTLLRIQRVIPVADVALVEVESSSSSEEEEEEEDADDKDVSVLPSLQICSV